jgi:hypothetical protein
LNREANVARNVTEQRRRDVPALMHRYRGDAAVRVPELFVRTTLPDFPKAQPL